MEALKYLHISQAIRSGIVSSMSEDQKALINAQTRQCDCDSFNPLPEEILSEITIILGNRENIKMSGLKKDWDITRSDLMITYACFANDHKLSEVAKFTPFADGVFQVVEKIEDISKFKGSSVGLAEQLNIGMDVADNDLTKAVIFLSLGTREMARVSDGRMLKNEIDRKRAFHWKKIVKAFGYNEEFEDSAGDTYHFWFGVLAGISRGEKFDKFPANGAKQLFCDAIYPYTAFATEVLRHELYLKIHSWNTHEIPDKVGYHVGRALVEIYSV